VGALKCLEYRETHLNEKPPSLRVMAIWELNAILHYVASSWSDTGACPGT